MITQPENSVKLTPSQDLQVAAYEKKLAAIQYDSVVAQKNLKQFRIELEKTTNERIYQEKLLADLTKEVATLQTRKRDLLGQVTDSEDIVKTNTELARIAGVENDKRAKELDTRESLLERNERDLTQRTKDFETKSAKLSEEQLKVAKAQDAFLKAAETVVWK